MATTAEPEVIWRANGGPQEMLLDCPIAEVFYGGARGGGKTDGLIGDFVSHAAKYGQHAMGLLVRRTYPELDDVIRRSKEVLGPLGWSYREQSHDWTAPNGALLRLRYLRRDADAASYQGHSYTWVGVDEAGNFPSAKPINLLRGTLRSGHGVPCVLRLTGNPGGPGHGWLKRRYIDPHPHGFEPFTYTENGVPHEAVFIPSGLDDNPHLGVEYDAQLAAATAGDDALYQAWRFGNWDVFVGQMYRLERGVQIVPNRQPAQYGPTYRWFATLDWGYVQGCFGLHAVDPEGRVELVWEFYDDFTELHARKAAHAIVDGLRRYGWPIPETIHADEQMWQEHGSGAVTLAEEFRKGLGERLDTEAPNVIEAEHRPGSRETKVALIHQWLAAGDGRDEQGRALPWALPFYRISERCANTIRVLQEIPRDPDNQNDVDPDYTDDHPHDMVGFAVASRPHPGVRQRKPTPQHVHPGLKRDGLRKTREWSEVDELQDWLKANGVGNGGRYGRRVGS
jgi:hypothetical protein